MPAMDMVPPDSAVWRMIVYDSVYNPESQEYVGPITPEGYLILTLRGMQVWANLLASVAKQQAMQGAVANLARNVAYRLYIYGRKITHVSSGSLRASERINPTGDASSLGGAGADLSIDRTAVNYKYATRPFQYGPVEHARGGDHAFYYRTWAEHGPRAVELEAAALRRSMQQAMYAGRDLSAFFETQSFPE